MAVEILITGDYRDRDIKRAHRDLDLLGKQSGTTGAAFSKMSAIGVGMGAAVGAAAIGAAAAGARMAVTLGVDGVKAAIEDEAAVSKLAQTMTNLGLAHDTAQVEASIASMETELGIVDMELRPAYDRLVRSIGDTDGAMKAMSLAADISAGTGKTLDAVVQALGRAYDGNTQGLSRLGAGLSATLLKSNDMKAITQQLATTFGGQATTKAQTYEGQIKRLGLQFDNLKEAFGAGFLQALGATEGKTGDLLQAMEDLKPALEDVGEAVGDLVVDLAGLVVASNKAGKAGKRLLEEPNWGDLGTVLREAAASNSYLIGTLIQGIPVIGPYVNLLYNLVGGYDSLAGSANDAYLGVSRTAMAMGKGTDELRKVISPTVAAAIKAGKTTAVYTGKLTDLNAKVEEVARASTSAADKTVILTDRQKNLALTMAGTQVAVKQATDDLAALTKASDDYAASITGAIKGTVDLSTAFSAAQQASQDGTLAAGESVVSTTIANFRAQILAAQQFAESLKNVAGAGGSQALIDQILQVAATQGPGAGAFLANTLVNDGVVPELTADLAAFNVFAGEAGTAMADNFYAQGITDAVQLLQGLSDEVAAQQKMLDRLGRNIGLPIAAAISEEIAKAIRDGIADGRAVAARRRASAFAAASFVPITVAPGTTGPTAPLSGGGMVNIPGRAIGGPASAGRPYIVGERGPELFVPGSNGNVVPNNAMGGNTYQITVQAGVGDPRAIGQSIVEYVRKFEQANGPVFRAA
jgi:hypothetical protein